MRAIIWGEWRQVLRNPASLLSLIALTIIFASLMGNSGGLIGVIPVYSTHFSEQELEQAVAQLNRDEAIVQFVIRDESNINSGLINQSYELAIELKDEHYQLFVARETPLKGVVEAELQSFYQQRDISKKGYEITPYTSEMYVKSETFDNEQTAPFDQALHTLFGMSLFFVVYTVSFSIQSILNQKEYGLWDRIILSPTTKTDMYVGQILFGFQIGYAQLLITYSIFKWIIGVDFYGGFWWVLVVIIPYVAALVSLGVLLSGLVTNLRQMNGIIPFVSVSIAMLGGAFFPLDIVSAEWILWLSKISPITYGLEMLKGATVYQWSLEQFLLPASILFGMSVLFMGIGLNLMERRAEYKKS